MKHHYVPRFLLRRWCDARGKLQSFKVTDGRVVSNALAPEYTGYEDGLYAVSDNPLGIEEDHIEKRLFGPIDNDAAVALGKIERHEAITPKDKIAWAFFLNSLRLRKPDIIEHMRVQGMEMLRRFLAEGDAALPAGWPSSEQWLAQHYPGMMETQSLVSWLSQIVLHDELTKRFHGLDWWVLSFKPEAPKLLLSDLPIHWEGGLNTDRFLIQLPIGPDRIFFGTDCKATEDYLTKLPSAELIRRVNRSSLASSSNRIWGADAAEGCGFIKANLDALGTNVEPFDAVAKRYWETRGGSPPVPNQHIDNYKWR